MLSIAVELLWSNRDGQAASWFHPRVCVVPGSKRSIMTLQTIGGSDFYGPVMHCWSEDDGHSWTTPRPIPGLGRIGIAEELEEGVCDTVPDYHAATGKIIALGHNVYYRQGRLFDSLADFTTETLDTVLRRYPVYTVYDPVSGWNGKRLHLEHELFRRCSIYSCGCSQKVILPDGSMIIPLTFGFFDRRDRMVVSCLAAFDGERIMVRAIGSMLMLPIGRGLLEPSLILYRGRYFMTIRAEDGHGHVTSSADGLEWTPLQVWRWNDGTELEMSTTQQHWLELDGRLYLVYNRKTTDNEEVFRWRAPLLIAEVNPVTMRLEQSSEQIVFPCRRGGNDPAAVPGMGNFHPTAISATEAIITVGEEAMHNRYRGDTLLARIKSL